MSYISSAAFRSRVVRCARDAAALAVLNQRRGDPPASVRLAEKVQKAPDSDLIFTVFALRLDPGDDPDARASVGTDPGLLRAVQGVWAQVAIEYDPAAGGA